MGAEARDPKGTRDSVVATKIQRKHSEEAPHDTKELKRDEKRPRKGVGKKEAREGSADIEKGVRLHCHPIARLPVQDVVHLVMPLTSAARGAAAAAADWGCT